MNYNVRCLRVLHSVHLYITRMEEIFIFYCKSHFWFTYTVKRVVPEFIWNTKMPVCWTRVFSSSSSVGGVHCTGKGSLNKEQMNATELLHASALSNGNMCSPLTCTHSSFYNVMLEDEVFCIFIAQCWMLQFIVNGDNIVTVLTLRSLSMSPGLLPGCLHT